MKRSLIVSCKILIVLGLSSTTQNLGVHTALANWAMGGVFLLENDAFPSGRGRGGAIGKDSVYAAMGCVGNN